MLLITITKGAGLPLKSISGPSVPLLVRVVRSLGLESSWGFFHSSKGNECTARPEMHLLRLAAAAS